MIEISSDFIEQPKVEGEAASYVEELTSTKYSVLNKVRRNGKWFEDCGIVADVSVFIP